MARAQIRFSTDILRRLGEELNPAPDQGIVELIKNAYDADARKCMVRLFDTNKVGGRIQIIDDGDGMDAGDIESSWLILGRSPKTKTQRTRLGRVPAGSKGLGRLAALRMGETVKLVTRPRSEKSAELSLRIDWPKYDRANVVEDVVLDIRESLRANRTPSGTEVSIEDLKITIGRSDVKQLARAMILLADPFASEADAFEPVLDAPEFKDLEELVKKRYFNQADYHLVASVNRDGVSRAKVVDWRGQTLFKASHAELASSIERERYRCPPASFDLWVFLLNKDSFGPKSVSVFEVRKWLEAFGGVHLYENRLRVQPYGNPGNDWLDMNRRRAQSPEERPSTNTSIGRVAIIDTRESLLQKTDRSGFVETESFKELRQFAQDAMEWMARIRLADAERRRARDRKVASKKSAKSKDDIHRAIQGVPEKSRKQVRRALAAYERDHQKEVDTLRREVQLYRTLSTAGITAATFAHESSGNPIKLITYSIAAIERRAKKELAADKFFASFQEPIESIKGALSSLSVLGSATLRLLDQGKRRWGRVDVHEVIVNVSQTFAPFLEGRSVVIDLQLANGHPYLRGTEAALESIVTNLLNNSLAAFERAGTESRKIRVETKINSSSVTLRVADNGPGIVGINKRYIWLPGQTTQPNGTGLGLTIVHDAAQDLGGEVDAIERGVLGGAEVLVKLPILGS